LHAPLAFGAAATRSGENGVAQEARRRGKESAMHTVMWTFRVPAGTSREALRETIARTAHTYLNIPGLVRKYYGIAEDGQSIVGIYLWRSREQAHAFYTPDWVRLVTERWGAVPLRAEWETPMVVESEAGRLDPA
jgi:hypothetical protein